MAELRDLPRSDGEEEGELDPTDGPNYRRDRVPDGNDNDLVRLATFW